MTAKKGSDLRVGTPERESARAALEEHLMDGRIDPAEFEQRLLACQAARTRSQIREIFADLPDPHPVLAKPAGHDAYADVGPGLGVLTLILGLPVSIIMGIVYGAWWSLAVAVAVPFVVSLLAETWAARQRRLR